MEGRSILRNQVRDHLLRQIHNGDLEIGRSINLAELSRTLGVSVTPIREALSQLEYAKVVKAIPNSGFLVPRLNQKEANDLYNVVAQLEMTALELISFSEKDLKKLRSSLQRLSEADNPLERLKQRLNFHDVLLRNCDNEVVLQVLESLKMRLIFYEQQAHSDLDFHKLMINQHEGIIQAIEENNIPTACLVLKMNWMAVLEYVSRQIPSW